MDNKGKKLDEYLATVLHSLEGVDIDSVDFDIPVSTGLDSTGVHAYIPSNLAPRVMFTVKLRTSPSSISQEDIIADQQEANKRILTADKHSLDNRKGGTSHDRRT